MVKLFSIFSRGTIIFVQASLIRLFFLIILLNHNSKATSDFQYICIYYYFCQFQVISVTIVAFSSFSGRVPTILSTSVYTLAPPASLPNHSLFIVYFLEGEEEVSVPEFVCVTVCQSLCVCVCVCVCWMVCV